MGIVQRYTGIYIHSSLLRVDDMPLAAAVQHWVYDFFSGIILAKDKAYGPSFAGRGHACFAVPVVYAAHRPYRRPPRLSLWRKGARHLNAGYFYFLPVTCIGAF